MLVVFAGVKGGVGTTTLCASVARSHRDLVLVLRILQQRDDEALAIGEEMGMGGEPVEDLAVHLPDLFHDTPVRRDPRHGPKRPGGEVDVASLAPRGRKRGNAGISNHDRWST